ncbi:MAG: hypothetical protein IKV07_05005 [Bacteroidaceae bacterium]|nr:hypothetical protein [Bacteroidaceae bacterium]
MKKTILFLMLLCTAFAVQAQSELPYSKYLGFSKKEFKENKFIIQTEVEPWSEYLEKQATKQAKRDAKNKKKQNVEDLM